MRVVIIPTGERAGIYFQSREGMKRFLHGSTKSTATRDKHGRLMAPIPPGQRLEFKLVSPDEIYQLLDHDNAHTLTMVPA